MSLRFSRLFPPLCTPFAAPSRYGLCHHAIHSQCSLGVLFVCFLATMHEQVGEVEKGGESAIEIAKRYICGFEKKSAEPFTLSHSANSRLPLDCSPHSPFILYVSRATSISYLVPLVVVVEVSPFRFSLAFPSELLYYSFQILFSGACYLSHTCTSTPSLPSTYSLNLHTMSSKESTSGASPSGGSRRDSSKRRSLEAFENADDQKWASGCK